MRILHSFFFTLTIVLSATSLTSAQDKTDTIKVYYEPVNSHSDNLEYYVDSVLVKNVHVSMFKPNDIVKMEVVKGVKNKIYITLKSDVIYSFVSLQFLGDKYLKSRETNGVLYTVDGKLITDPDTLINIKDILSVSIAADQNILSLPHGKVTLLKILTKSKLNIDDANKTNIRGKALGSL